MIKRNLIYIFILLLTLSSCDDKIIWGDGGDMPTDTKTSGIYILCEGLFNMNNSTISYYDFTKGEMLSFQDPDKRGDNKTSYDFFKMQNGRKLGDTANDLQRYGSKLWCAVDVSSQIEVMDLSTGMSIRQIPIFNEQGVGREPRHFTFYRNKAYICNFDGTVAKIDTTSLALEEYVKVGRNPDGICAANGKLYVANSGGLNQENPDNTVSVIDVATFKEIKRIEVRNNLGTILSDASGNVYVVSREKFNHELNDYDCKLHRIDSETDKVVTTYDLPILSFTISGNKAYMYSYNSQKGAIVVMDTRTGQIIDNDFIKDETSITHIYNITVNPINEDVYICDAQNYIVNGSIICFDKNGYHQFTFDAKGINPNSIVFTATPFEELPNEPDTDPTYTNGISKVFEYAPAPGQFVNQLPTYSPSDDEAVMCNKSLQNFNKGYLVSLGGFGGYITVGMDKPIINRIGEFDFRILGNAYEGSSEPGIVLVSKDTNDNNLPDDEWFELKGSEYDNPKTIHKYEITYYKPSEENSPVRWTDNQGAEGTVPRTIHTQNYYPSWVTASKIILKGSRLPNNGAYDISLNKWIMSSYAFGYADNQANNSNESKFNIDWAIDNKGNSVSLDKVNFIRIYTAVNQAISGSIGELSTEIKGIETLHLE